MARFADAAQADQSICRSAGMGGRKTDAGRENMVIFGGIKNRKPLNAGTYLPFNSPSYQHLVVHMRFTIETWSGKGESRAERHACSSEETVQ
jgi:hypothetical protein